MPEKQDSEQNQKLECLAVAALEGLATADEVDALEELLSDSEKDRRRFLEFAAFECALEDAIKEDAPGSHAVVGSSKRWLRGVRRVRKHEGYGTVEVSRHSS